jgi:hypothetical protein
MTGRTVIHGAFALRNKTPYCKCIAGGAKKIRFFQNNGKNEWLSGFQ